MLIISPRYADDLAAMAQAAGLSPRLERAPMAAAARFAAEPARVVVVDARGALPAGLAVAQALGGPVEAQRSAMLVLLSRGDAEAAQAALAAGATSVLVSPFGGEAFANALRLADRHAARLAKVAATPGAPVLAGDTLTGLADSERLVDWLDAAVVAGRPVAVIMLGVARLAQISMLHGRDVADRLLVAIARRLGPLADGPAQRGESRLLGRLSGSDFALAVAGHGGETAMTDLARQLVQAFQRPFAIDDRLINVAGRAGLAMNTASEDGGHGLLREASLALAKARLREPGAVARFSAEAEGALLRRQADLESGLYRAIGDGDIALLFQPQARLETGRIEGVEALVRWDHPVHGRLSAATLLETAASVELAVVLGRHIRARAIAAAAAWTGPLAGLKLSINVTAADLADADFVDTLATDLARAGLSPRRLVLEVTEDAVIDDMDGAAATLALLRRDGVTVALDDFGTGYSSLARLARLPVDVIKLDRSFAQGLVGTDREKLVVTAMISTARRLGLSVVAEGVEDDVQRAAAQAAGCHLVQGYCVAPPLDEISLAALCTNNGNAVGTA
ncbi:hypothetical protein CHU93_00335 [Sandarakinorhabdus cyanobacteriorum]|uniref:EAL domain-containing protein n=1 Tax=Sandarakinorhabdus cyanobacteriorum TaxID=1981098 RepID=A0A255Z8Q5_9SPHN|nr:hypothetical protein CHU93_00335 [Sandarakinorhabdus cyanobacteriorum]